MNKGLAENKSVEAYLGYLKLEMSIMGMLSTFCIATLALLLKEIAEAENGHYMEEVWKRAYLWISVGLVLLLVAAFVFYRQRALLANYYGWLCLTLNKSTTEQQELLAEAEGKDTWLSYRIAFACLSAAMIG